MTDFKLNCNLHIHGPRRPEGGFTILELLVAMSLLAIILAIVYETFSTVIQSTEDTRLASFEIRTRQFLNQSFKNNLAQATEGWSPGAAYRLSTATEGDGSSAAIIEGGVMRYRFEGTGDSLSFVSSAPLAGNSGLPGMVKFVVYEVTAGSTDENLAVEFGVEPAMTLQVTESPLAVASTGFGGGLDFRDLTRDRITQATEASGMDSAGWDIPIDSISFQYFDGDIWQETWDSQNMGRLPWAVDVRINFPASPDAPADFDRDPFEAPDLRLVLIVPVGAGIRDEPPDYVRPEESNREQT